MMKRLAILFFCLLAGKSLADNCDFHQKINDSFLCDVFVKGADAVPVPSLEYGEQSGYKFAKEFASASSALGYSLMLNVHNQAQKIGDKLIDTIRNDTSQLIRSIGLIGKNNETEICLDNDLNRLKNQVQVFLNLIPGKALIRQEALPDLPVQQTEIKSRTEPHSASNIFLGFEKLVDEDIASFFGYLEAATLAGWSALRASCHISRMQYRNQILNGPVMDAYRQAVDEVFEKRQLIRNNVTTKTWTSFEEVGNRVVEISDDYKSWKKNENC